MNDFVFDRNDLKALSKYYALLTREDDVTFLESIELDIEVGEDTDPHRQLTNGLTTLYRACWDLTDLFNIAAHAKDRTKKLELFILGALFEAGNKIDSWVSAPLCNFYESRGKDPFQALLCGKDVRSLFKTHRPGLKLVRNRIFHAHPWHSDEVVFRLAEAMYKQKIPGQLHKSLVDYGIRTVEQLCKDDIGILGIGCFDVTCIEGRNIQNTTYNQLGNEYWR